jgi:acetyl esterase/lipase
MTSVNSSIPRIPLPAANDVSVEDVEYQSLGGVPLLARLYRPVGVVAKASVLDVHGGGWFFGDRTAQQSLDYALAASGLLVAAIDFRMPPAHPYPGQLVDVNFGIRWLKQHAVSLGARDGAKTGVFGGSSGGHVVILAGMRPHDPRYSALELTDGDGIDATVDFVITDAPVSDPFAQYQTFSTKGPEDKLEIFLKYWQTPEAANEGSPTRILERGEPVELPPLFISQGTEDEPVPLAGTRAFVARYAEAGGEVEFLTFDGLGHGFILYEPERAESVQQAEAVLAFIDRHI